MGIVAVTTALAGGMAIVPSLATGAGAAVRPTVRLDVTRHGANGRDLSVRLVVGGVADLGGVQGTLRYDARTLDVTRARTASGLTGLQAIDFADRPDRLPFASYGHVAASAPTAVETIDALATAAGTIEVRVDGLVLVARDGTPIAAPTTASTTVAVARSTPTWRAPRGADAVVHPRAHRADVDGDRTVTGADVTNVALAWALGHETDSACAAPQPGTDVDGDGCITVADLAATASSVTAARHVATPRNLTASGATVFTVDTTSDAPDASPGDGTCAISGGGCSLRAAVQEANAAPGAATINFDIGGGGQQTIQLASALPALVNPLGITIDATTQPGSVVNSAVIGDTVADNAVYGIVLHGGGMSKYNAFNVPSSFNVIHGFDIYGFGNDVNIDGTTQVVSNNVVAGNLLGLDPAGNFDPTLGGLPLNNGASCVVIRTNSTPPLNGANHNTIGGPNAADRNVISGCGHDGVGTYVYGSNFNVVQNNVVGLDPSGTQARGSISMGVDLNTGSSRNTITGNIISGNKQDGIEISHNPATQNDIATGNYIGTDTTGNGAPAYAGNGQFGIHFEGYPACNTMSPPVCPADNANHLTASNNVIVSSKVGGVVIEKGIWASTVANNLIGVTPNGTAGPNKTFGIDVAAGSSNNTIGPANVITNNDAGVTVEQMARSEAHPPAPSFSPLNGVTITQNSIFANNGTGTPALGIDLAPFGSTNQPGTADPNVNDGILPPVFGAVNGSAVTVNASGCSGCTIEVFLADQGPGASGSGETYLASATTDSSGVATVALPANASGQVITATVTDTLGSTSEFAKNVAVGTLTNAAPTAKFTPTCSHFTCTFDASASFDPDGTVTSYSWSFGDGTNGVGVNPSHTYATTGTFTVALTVVDNQGLASAPVAKNVTAANAAPIASFSIIGPTAGPPPSCNGAVCDFDGSASHDPDAGDSIVSFAWDFGDGTSGSSATKPAHTFSLSCASGPPCLYVVTLNVTDNHGAVGSVAHTIEINSVGSQGTGAFSTGPIYSVGESFKPISGDFNGDGKTDVMWFAPGTAPDYVWTSTGNGFAPGPHINNGGSYIPIPGDFNGDGKTDVMWYAPGPAPDYVWTSTGTGFVAGPHIVNNGSYIPIPGDFNGDHKTDVLWYARGTAPDYVWISTGTGFVAGPHVSIVNSFVPIPGDFNGDGKGDILWYAPGSAADAVWYANAAGNGFVGGAHLSILGSYIPIPGDYNSDGFTDVFWLGPGTAPDYLWRGCLMNSQCPMGFRAGPGVAKSGTPIGVVGNFNGLGNDDILWYTPGPTTEPMWYGLG